VIASALLHHVAADVGDLVVGDRDGDQEHVLGLAPPVCVEHVGEQSEARRQELSGPRTAALEVPLEREALLDQVVDVLVQDELVGRVVLEAAADEEDAAAADQRPDGEEVHVDAAGGVVRRMAGLVERVLQHQVVEIRLVRRHEHDGASLCERVDLLELAVVVAQHVAVALRVDQPDDARDQVDHVGAVRRGDLAEIAQGFLAHARLAAAQLGREPSHAAAERGPRHDLLGDEARHLVAGAAHAALGPLEREGRLPDNELRQAHGRVDAGSPTPAPAKLREPRGLGRDHPAALRMPPEDPVLAQPARISRVTQAKEVAEPGRAFPVALRRAPGHAQGGQHRIVPLREVRLEARIDAPGAAPSRGRNPDLIDRARPVGGPSAFDPLLEQPLLQRARGVEQEDHPLAALRRPRARRGPQGVGGGHRINYR
jgi:hypothetical protein